MLKLYKDLMIGYYVVAFTGMALMWSLRETWNNFSFFALLVVWVYLVMIFFNLLAGKRLNKVKKIMDECRLQEAAAAYEKLLHRNASTNTLSFLKINLSAAYCGMGKIDEAREVLADAPVVGKGVLATQLRPVMENNLAALDCLENRLPDAQEHLTQCETFLQEKRISKENRAGTARACEDNRAVVAMKRGDFPAAEALFTRRLSDPVCLREQMMAHWWLGEICEKTGRAQEATEHYRFCAEKGGDTWQAARAREKLKEE